MQRNKHIQSDKKQHTQDHNNCTKKVKKTKNFYNTRTDYQQVFHGLLCLRARFCILSVIFDLEEIH
jgi:hypothetical protein